MPPKLTVADLKRTLSTNRASWTVNPRLRDTDEVPGFSTGADPRDLKLARDVAKIRLDKILEVPTSNPKLLEEQARRGLVRVGTEAMKLRIAVPGVLAPAAAPDGGTEAAAAAPPPDGGAPLPAVVDWRNRWGTSWITSVRDQNGCNACWAFASTALVESMARIEHTAWCTRSEGDIHKGIGKVCANLGNLTESLNFVKNNGQCDPGSFPWTSADIPYAPSSDRGGRTVKIADYQWVGSIEDQKNWLDTVGPLATWFMVWWDFQLYGSGVYSRQATINGQPNVQRGGHFMLIVGYDDNQGCWIVKNSWGTGWGENGYARIAYGQCEIDKYGKAGLRNTNTDPWTKRRMHNGAILESGNGATHRNFELLATAGSQLRLFWRNNSVGGLPWGQGAPFGPGDAVACPTLTATTYNRNFEAVYLTAGSRLRHYWFSQAAGTWNDGGIFGPTDAWGIPGFIQGNYNAPGNFEVVVRTKDGRLNHWWRLNGSPWTWKDGGRFGANVALSGPSLIQSSYGKAGNFELVCVLTSGKMQHWWRDNDNGMVWKAGPTFGSGISSPPVMIQGVYGTSDERGHGNFELCVAAGGQVQHWWRNNAGDGLWRHSATFGQNVRAVAGMLQGSFGYNLEVVVLRNDNKLQHYWRDGAGWHAGVVIGSA